MIVERAVCERLGRNVRAYRKYRRLNQPAVAAMVAAEGVPMTAGVLSRIETGARTQTTVAELIALVRVLDCTFSDLIGYDPKGR